MRLSDARHALSRRRRPPADPDELIAELEHLGAAGADPSRIADGVQRLSAVVGFKRTSTVAGRLVRTIENSGDLGRAVALSLQLTRAVDGRYARLAHDTALRCADLTAAEEAARLAQGQPWLTPALATSLEVERRLAGYDVPAALALLDGLPRPLDGDDSFRYVRAMEAIGRFADVLAFIQSPDHRLDPITATLHEADARRWLGEQDEATRLVNGLATDHFDDMRVLARMRDWGLAGDELVGRLRQLEQRTPPDPDAQVRVLALYWELGSRDDADRVARTIETAGDVGDLPPMSRLQLARYHHGVGELDRSLELLGGLRNSPRRQDAEKLRARILLEQGEVARALATSQACPRPQGFMDLVSFSALLHQRRFPEAFALAPNPKEMKPFVAVFGGRADVDGSALPRAGSRFVIAQGGPGDGIRFAATYRALRTRSDELVVTCDPRLVSLLQRSFPDIEFLPVERFNGRRPGGCGPDAPPRSDDVLYEWMTAQARDRAAECDRVMLERSLYHLSVDGDAGAPYAAYLEPRGDLVDAFTQRWPVTRRRVGLVWRSELRGPTREVQYLSSREVAPLAGPDDFVVCLQYDATPNERDELTRLSRAHIEFVDDVDLRNDFESTAALLASLDVVVGVDTTMSELSGAVGTPTLFLQPTFLGAWRAVDAGHDYWYASTRIVTGEPPSDRRSLLDRGGMLLRQLT